MSALEPVAEILPEDEALKALKADMILGNVGLLLIDMQWDYFFRGRLKARGGSERIQNDATAVTGHAYSFLNDLRETALPLHKIWVLHTVFASVRHKLQKQPGLLRNEFVIRPDIDDAIIPKNDICAFDNTKLHKTAQDRKIVTFLVGGGFLEVCVASSLVAGSHNYDYNFVLIPELTLALHGSGESYIRSHFQTAVRRSAYRGWGAVLNASQVLDTVRSVTTRHALTPAA